MKITIDNQKDDIITAQKIVSRNFEDILDTNFYRNSGIYNFTNEVISSANYKREITNKSKILSVIGSGDQILNSILLGSKDITGFDISIFPKYYLLLKIGAIKTLSKDEFLNFFSFIGKEEEMGITFDKISKYLDPVSLEFWESLYDYFEYYEVSSSMLFNSSYVNRKVAENYNPYLQDEKSYNELREKLQDVKLNLVDGNIYNLVKEGYFKEPFDLANVSNILGYNKLKDNRELLEKIPLNKNAKILGYVFYIALNEYKEKEKRLIEDSLTNRKIITKVSDITSPNGSALILTKKRRNYGTNRK